MFHSKSIIHICPSNIRDFRIFIGDQALPAANDDELIECLENMMQQSKKHNKEEEDETVESNSTQETTHKRRKHKRSKA